MSHRAQSIISPLMPYNRNTIKQAQNITPRPTPEFSELRRKCPGWQQPRQEQCRDLTEMLQTSKAMSIPVQNSHRRHLRGVVWARIFEVLLCIDSSPSEPAPTGSSGAKEFFVANKSVCDPWDLASLRAVCGGLLDDGHDACVVIPRVTPGHGEVAAHAPLVGEGGMSRVPVDVNQHVAVHGVEVGAADVESHPDFPVAWDT